MKDVSIQVIPYAPHHEQAILEIERRSGQGGWVNLEMLRTHYGSRADLFALHQKLVAIAPDGIVTGAVIGVKTPLGINGQTIQAGMGIDLRVDPDWRGRGIGRSLSVAIENAFFIPEGLDKYFIIAKASNHALKRMVRRMPDNTCTYTFHYLTISTSAKIPVGSMAIAEPRIHAILPGADPSMHRFIISCPGGIRAWNTSLMYTLRINKVHPLLALSTQIEKLFRKKEYPPLYKPFGMATLFDVGPGNFHYLNEALQTLRDEGIPFANIISTEDHTWYPLLKKAAVFSYEHHLITNFPITDKDAVTLDVRGL